ncbi:GNAT family N-acetyltransferase [Yokenella regensburgei]|uniref:GNAT family N-acetyltransferase n=1 Tax=Yokenella regensburgei TaxID=158877 RepID=UPI0002421CE3|nr:GNAT family N-acetyltransferase [Yokenella regensburgei]EHM51362.1 acetyltransferase, GNAT family [Yokenella regensburgei ATCC 43003]
MPFRAVPATQFSSEQLTAMLGKCFEGYSQPFSLPVDVFAQRFAAEGLSLVDSCVWMEGDDLVAVALIARRGQSARLAAFAIRPAWRGKGIGRKLLAQLMDSLGAKGFQEIWLEVIQDNHPGVALYQSLGFAITQKLCGYQGMQPGKITERALQETAVMPLLRRAMVEQAQGTPWLMDPASLMMLPCRAFIHQQAFAVVSMLTEKPQLRMIYVAPEKRHHGQGREILRALNQQFPGLATVVSVPEPLTTLFASAGYMTMAVQQFEMRAALV